MAATFARSVFAIRWDVGTVFEGNLPDLAGHIPQTRSDIATRQRLRTHGKFHTQGSSSNSNGRI
jgi:hypothetical protein